MDEIVTQVIMTTTTVSTTGHSSSVELPTWLTDAGWWQVILAVVALLVGFVFFALQRQNKALSYKILSNTDLVTVKKGIAPSITILLNDKPVENVHYLEVQMINSGDAPILPEDFKVPVSLDLGKNVQVIDVNLTKTDPPELRVLTSFTGSQVQFEPMLLNKNDSFSMGILCNRTPEFQNFSGRIVGVKQITLYSESRPINTAMGMAVNSFTNPLSLVIYALLFGIAIVEGIATNDFHSFWNLLTTILWLLGGGFIFFVLLLVLLSRLSRMDSKRRN